MMRSELLTKRYPDGELQRVQVVRWDDWGALRFLRGAGDPGTLEGVARIYRRFLIPACPWIFGQMLLFRLPEDLDGAAFGLSGAQPLTQAAALLRRGVRLRGGKPFFRSEEARSLWRALERAGCLAIARGRLPFTRVLPVGNESFLLSRVAGSAQLAVNASFFILDAFDCATRYDVIGTPFGLAVEDGRVLCPPLYGREALVVRRGGRVSVETPALEALSVRLGGKAFRPGVDAAVFTRPACRRTPRGKGWDHVIVDRTLADVVEGGGCEVPASGFVLRLAARTGSPGVEVDYGGMEDVLFAVQAGNSLVRGGRETERFVSSFYNIYRPWRTPYPPSLYPLDYEKARAARIALGADGAGKPILLWAEGAAKIGHTPGEDSCGASLSEFARICREAGMVEGVNLDGGGSAQILLRGKRSLQISDRDDDGREVERAVPLGLVIE